MVLFALHLAQTISSRTAFQVSCFLFPFTPLHFHHFRAPSLPRRLTHARIWTPPFDASCQWVCCSALHLKSDSNHPLIRCTSPLKCAPPGILPKQHRAKKNQTISSLFRHVLDHPSKVLYDPETKPLFLPLFWFYPIYKNAEHCLACAESC